jgi:hypothetical protein
LVQIAQVSATKPFLIDSKEIEMKVVCSFCHNHSTLVDNVYPTRPGEEGPKSSALSLLLFYATSKPQKLPKIGTYIEQRVVLDMKKSRYGYYYLIRHVKVSMDIINSLLNECKQGTGVLSKQIQRTILLILNCPEFDLILPATNTVILTNKFVLYSNLRNCKDVIDSESKTLFQELVKKFCACAMDNSPSPILRNKARICGLKALGALCPGNVFVEGSTIDSGMEPILSALLANLKCAEQNASNSNLNVIPTMGDVKRASLADQLISDIELCKESEKCFEGIFCNTNANSLRSLFSIVVK